MPQISQCAIPIDGIGWLSPAGAKTLIGLGWALVAIESIRDAAIRVIRRLSVGLPKGC